jgi:hypothetical protein
MNKLTVVTEALRREAKKWLELSDEMEKVEANVGRLTLDSSAFWCGDGISIEAAPVYSGFRDFVEARCGEGKREFEEIAGALRRAADDYDGTDQVSAETLQTIYGKV